MTASFTYMIFAGALGAFAIFVWLVIRAITARYDRAENNAAKAAQSDLRADVNQAASETQARMDKAAADFKGAKDALEKGKF